MIRSVWQHIVISGLTMLLAASPALGDRRDYDFKLTPTNAICDGIGTYAFDANWVPLADSTVYAFASGNNCQLNGKVCRPGGGCGTVTCNGSPCTVRLTNCEIGRGAAWTRVVDQKYLRLQNAVAKPPGYCRGSK